MEISVELLVLIAVGALLLLWFLVSLFYPVAGDWVKDATLGPEANKPTEKIIIGQFGPFIVGRQEYRDGYQTYSGLTLGRKIWLKRRDFGVGLLKRQGFPLEIAQDIEGQILARLKLQLSNDRLFLVGEFYAYKVEFNLKPPRVSAITKQKPQKRTYRKVEFAAKKAMANAPSYD